MELRFYYSLLVEAANHLSRFLSGYFKRKGLKIYDLCELDTQKKCKMGQIRIYYVFSDSLETKAFF